MSRVSKDPQIRIEEILDAAELLFKTKGYHETMVSDIVKHIGVAQGTFYYYFKSKEEVLESIVKRSIFQLLGEIETVADTAVDAPTKISLVINHTINSFLDQNALPFEYLYNDEYLHVLDKIMRQGKKRVAPLLLRIVREGMQQGCFKVVAPEETVEFMTAILDCFCEACYSKSSSEQVRNRLTITKQLLENILGFPAGTLQIEV